MLARLAVRAGFIAALLACANAAAQSFDPSALKLLQAMERAPTTLARYRYLVRKTPSLSSGDQVLALQFMAFSENELGLYDQAVFGFLAG